MRSSSLAFAPALVSMLAARSDQIRIHVDPASILGYVLIGLVVGLVARLLVPGSNPIGLLATIAIGVIGAMIGGWLAGAVFRETPGVDWIASILVAMVLVLLLRAGSVRRPTWGRRW